MAHERSHPRAEPDVWPVLAMGGILAAQVALLQVAVNRLAWGLYPAVLAPAAGVAALALVAWLLYLQIDR